VAGDLGQAQVAASAIAAEPVERGIHAQPVVLGEYPLGLFDHHPAGQGGLELFVDDLAAVNGPLLQAPEMARGEFLG
jgi:hypothetical protein